MKIYEIVVWEILILSGGRICGIPQLRRSAVRTHYAFRLRPAAAPPAPGALIVIYTCAKRAACTHG